MRQRVFRDCAVTVTALPGSRRADVRISGDVDLAAGPALTEAVARVVEHTPATVFVDLAGITFAGSELLNFLFQTYNRLPRGSALVVCRTDPMTRAIFAATGLTRLLTMRDHLLN